MNLRNATNYNIGLDIGTASVGWAVTDEAGELYRFKSKPTWGSRLFPSANTAAETRIHRGQRRRYDRRRQRLDLLQRMFAKEMEQLDPAFFIRLNQSRLLPEDRSSNVNEYLWPLFNNGAMNEIEYYRQFPTIYHLRAWLTETPEKADLRLIYLAFHNIVKHRGNFLHQDNAKLSAKNSSMADAIGRFCEALELWCEKNDVECACKPKVLERIFGDLTLRRANKVDALIPALGMGTANKKIATALVKAALGYGIEFATIFFMEPNESKFSLANDEKAEGFESLCPEEGMDLFLALRAVYSSYVLLGILKGADGGTLSVCKIEEYEQYGADLALLKRLVKKHVPEKYDLFFRGAFYEGTNKYDPKSAKGYTQYNLGTSKLTRDDFYKEILSLFKETDAENDQMYADMLVALEENVFLRRLKTSDNGVIPYQLHLEELKAIIDNQSVHYPFLEEYKYEIETLVTFRIPYYVGPLTQKHAALDAQGRSRFAWSVRKLGKENEKIYPWNWDDVIDKDASAEAFMLRMTGTCTYLQGEAVLPRCSLVYEMFCVLNELSGAKWTRDGDSFNRFDAADRMAIVEDLFKKTRTISYARVQKWLSDHARFGDIRVSGGQGETGFESKLSSYNDFCRFLGTDELSDADMHMAEEIIYWNTLFEDRRILQEKVEKAYGNRLDATQIKMICRKRYTGWGRLSKKLLTRIKASTDNGPKSIMDILIEGDQNHQKHLGRAMTLMEILHDDTLEFEKRIAECNVQYAAGKGGLTVDDMQGSPALRRGVKQALRIVEEIVRIAGCPPKNIFVEVTRDEDGRNKGKRTNRRYNNLKDALEAFKKEDPYILSELKGINPSQLNERLTLYFMQRGKSMYSGKALDINCLSQYQVDHIIPQSYIKDDSFENKVLVLPDENQRKSDTLLLDNSIIHAMLPFWKGLLQAKLIGEKKFNNLTSTAISGGRIKGFIARQLVETSQIVKFVQLMLNEKYEDTTVVPIKAGLSSQLRDAKGLIKCREINDYHHAHDAFLACKMGQFIQLRHSDILDNPIKAERIVRAFLKAQGQEFKRTRKMPGSSGFIVGSFLRSGFDKETGELFTDNWDAECQVDFIRTCLNYRDCFISRMPEETSGAFWDATIYSPRNTGKTLSLPLKKGLDTKKYGGYSSEKFAYFFIYKASDSKNRDVFEFAPVPVSVASSLTGEKQALEHYATKDAQEKGLNFVRVIKSKIYKYQQIILGSDRLYITGKKEVRNACQFAFSQKETAVVCKILGGDEVSSDEIDGLFEILKVKYDQYAPRLGALLHLDAVAESFCVAEINKRKDVIIALLSVSAAKTNQIDLSGVGGSKLAGKMQPTFSKEIGDSSREFLFVDISVTGMFERRYRLEL